MKARGISFSSLYKGAQTANSGPNTVDYQCYLWYEISQGESVKGEA